ncbi:MAG: hypothetical protein E6J91_48275 [Deltaproteobacteria bacterium]|nr:MAG: hypothetical protein E6J91_48275 [Deltaproteobacteria bacterium]
MAILVAILGGAAAALCALALLFFLVVVDARLGHDGGAHRRAELPAQEVHDEPGAGDPVGGVAIVGQERDLGRLAGGRQRVDQLEGVGRDSWPA